MLISNSHILLIYLLSILLLVNIFYVKSKVFLQYTLAAIVLIMLKQFGLTFILHFMLGISSIFIFFLALERDTKMIFMLSLSMLVAGLASYILIENSLGEIFVSMAVLSLTFGVLKVLIYDYIYK